ncbi:MAG: PAS domain S-box protein [Anaerolineaceae bacterium]|nr:PAS domain S-box protein [Anaerolineaceae bacterium]
MKQPDFNDHPVERNEGVLRITVIYFIFSALWITFSDQLIARITKNIPELTLLSTIKGWGFVIVTSILLYWLIRRDTRALIISEERFRALIENSADAVALISSDGIILYESPSVNKVLGYLPEEMVGHNIAEFINPDDLSTATNVFESVMKEALKPVSVQVRYKQKNGDWLWIESNSTNLLSKPAVQAIVINYRDITERKQAEQALQISERHFLKIFQASPVPIALANLTDGKVVNVNESFVHLLGYRADEVLGRTVEEMGLYAEYKQHAEILNIVHDQGEVKDYELALCTKTGNVRFVLASLDVLDLKDEDALTLGTFVDITERKQVQEALAASEAKLRALFSSMQDLVIVMDKDGVYRDIAPTVTVSLYRPPDELIGKNVYQVFPQQIADQFFQAIQKVLSSKQTTAIEYELITLDQPTWYEANISPMTDESTLWVVRDISARKLSEQRLQRQVTRLTALKEIDQMITSSFNLKFNLENILSQVITQLDVNAADILLLNPYLNRLEFKAGHGLITSEMLHANLPLGKGYTGLGVLKRNLMILPDIRQADPPFTRSEAIEREGFVSYIAVPLVTKGQIKGVLEVFQRTTLDPDDDWLNYLETLAGQTAIAVDTIELFERIQRSNNELLLAYDATIEGWSHALELRDREPEGHTQRVTDMTLSLAIAIGIQEEELVHIRRGALLHDIGKLGIPDTILFKAGALTDEEWEVMKQHPVFSQELLSPIGFLHPALDIPCYHHEKWDGSGYPRGFKGEEIPLAARIFAVVDVYDALTSDRLYRARWSEEKALEYLRSQCGHHFDPRLVDLFFKMRPKDEDLSL